MPSSLSHVSSFHSNGSGGGGGVAKSKHGKSMHKENIGNGGEADLLVVAPSELCHSRPTVDKSPKKSFLRMALTRNEVTGNWQHIHRVHSSAASLLNHRHAVPSPLQDKLLEVSPLPPRMEHVQTDPLPPIQTETMEVDPSPPQVEFVEAVPSPLHSVKPLQIAPQSQSEAGPSSIPKESSHVAIPSLPQNGPLQANLSSSQTKQVVVGDKFDQVDNSALNGSIPKATNLKSKLNKAFKKRRKSKFTKKKKSKVTNDKEEAEFVLSAANPLVEPPVNGKFCFLLQTTFFIFTFGRLFFKQSQSRIK